MQAADEKIFENVALRYFSSEKEVTDVLGGYAHNRQNKHILFQDGNGYDFGFFEVNSVKRIGNMKIWGEALYATGKKYDVKYNETSDYLLLYPYITSDSIGGDMETKKYHFIGGLSYRKNGWIVGVKGVYDAGNQYRDIDPRPRNITSSLNLDMALAYNLINETFIGINVSGLKYKQTNHIKFYNDLGVPDVLHFTGLGTDYYRFRGSNYDNYYNGYQGKATLDLYSLTNDKIIFATAGIRYFTFEKIISSLNELPMAKVRENELFAEAGIQKNDLYRKGISFSANLKLRNGDENIFDDAANNVYPLIETLNFYKHNNYNAKLNGFIGTEHKTYSWILALNCGIENDIETYKSPVKEQNFTNLIAGMNFNFTSRISKITSIEFCVSGEYNKNLSSFSSLSGSVIWEEPFIRYFEFRTSGYFSFNPAFKLLFRINEKLAMLVKTNYNHLGNNEIKSRNLNTAIGFEF